MLISGMRSRDARIVVFRSPDAKVNLVGDRYSPSRRREPVPWRLNSAYVRPTSDHVCVFRGLAGEVSRIELLEGGVECRGRIRHV